MTHLETKAIEESQYTITVGTTFTPATLKWRLVDEDADVVNSRTTVSVAVPSTSNVITISGDDLAMPDKHKPRRYFMIHGTDASAVPFADECSFDIKDRKGTT